MSSIVGTEYCKLDSNNRFKLPISIKKEMGNSDCRYVIRQCVHEPCLELWTYEGFQKELDFLRQKINSYSKKGMRVMRRLAAGTTVEMDSNDRMVIPNEHRGVLKGSKELILQSMARYVEIWDRDTYYLVNQDSDELSQEIDEFMEGLIDGIEDRP